MTRAYILLSWSLILLCGPAMAAETRPAAAQPAPPPCILTVADTMEKVFRDEPSDRPRAERLVIEAARNEVEGIQLVVAPPGKEDLRGRTVEIADLARRVRATRSPRRTSPGTSSATSRPRSRPTRSARSAGGPTRCSPTAAST